MNGILLTILLAPTLGVDNFFAGSGIGLSHHDVRTKAQAGGILGVFALGMPLAGLLLGHHLAVSLGQVGRVVGDCLLIGIGGYAFWTTRGRTDPVRPRPPRTIREVLGAGFGTNVDSLVVGLSLGVHAIPPFTAVVIIGGVTATMAVVGLELGTRLGVRMDGQSERLGGVVLAGLGLLLFVRSFGG